LGTIPSFGFPLVLVPVEPVVAVELVVELDLLDPQPAISAAAQASATSHVD
jgi:hypothetical protein